jgi:HEAT repeat protein
MSAVALALIGAAPVERELTVADIPASASPVLKALMRETFYEEASERAEAAGRLGTMGSAAAPAIPFLIRLLCDDAAIGEPDSYDFVSFHATESLKKIGKPGLEPCITALKKSKYDNRRELLSVIGSIDDPRAVDALLPYYRDPDAKTAQCAMGASAQCGSPRVIGPLGDVLRKSDDWTFRAASVSSLGYIRDRRAVDVLLTALKDRSVIVRCDTIRSLGLQTDARVVPALLEAMRHGLPKNEHRDVEDRPENENDSFRESAIGAVSQTHDPRAFGPLLAMLKEPGTSERVRTAAAFGLGTLGNRQASTSLTEILKDASEPDRLRVAALHSLADLDGPASTKVMSRLAKSDNEPNLVRFWAAIENLKLADGAIEDVEILDALKPFDAKGDFTSSLDSRMIAAEAALNKALKRGKSPAVRSTAAKILERMHATDSQ